MCVARKKGVAREEYAARNEKKYVLQERDREKGGGAHTRESKGKGNLSQFFCDWTNISALNNAPY